MGKVLEEIHQNIMVISECLRGRLMGNNYFLLCTFLIFQMFYNQHVLLYNKEINLKKTLFLPDRKRMPTKPMRILSTWRGTELPAILRESMTHPRDEVGPPDPFLGHCMPSRPWLRTHREP